MNKEQRSLYYRNWRLKNKKHLNKKKKEYRDKYPDRERETKKRYYSKNKDKILKQRRQSKKLQIWYKYYRKTPQNKIQHKCHNAVHQAIKKKKLTKNKCKVCGNPNSQAHHEDYTKPLDIIWLCSKHHYRKNRKL